MTPQEYIETFVCGKDYPEWMTKEGLITLASGYLLPGEVPKDAMKRVSDCAARYLNEPELSNEFFQIIWNGWLCLSSPVWSNFGSSRGLPISCFNSHVPDSIDGIAMTLSENIMMTKLGGGTSTYFGGLRGRGSKIGKGQGKSNGPKSFMQMFDSMIRVVSQGGVRRGMMAAYLDIDHPDIEEFLKIRKVGDEIQELTTGVCVSDDFIERIFNGDEKALSIWAKLLEVRNDTGVPYILFTDNANSSKIGATPPWYGDGTNYPIKSSNLCSEIMLPSSDEESFVCCLASLNLAKYDEWKNSNTVELAISFLDAVMSEFIDKTEDVYGMDRARKFAINHRALGLGVLGWHSFLQGNNIPFVGLQADAWTRIIFEKIRKEAEEASTKLSYLGVPKVLRDYGVNNKRNTTLLAIAPTITNAAIAGGVSCGIEPWPSNFFIKDGAKGTFLYKNVHLEKVLDEVGQNTDEVWKSIRDNSGSVQHLDFLSEEQKEIFLTFREINQFELVKQAGLRQQYIDQGVSLNINIPPDVSPKIRSKLYLTAHAYGVKSLYYQRSESIMKSGLDTMDPEGCASCSG